MGRRSKQKGSRREREFAEMIGGKRIPLSGGAKHLGNEFSGDVDGLGMKWEVKARKDGFKTLYKWLGEDHVDALAIRADRKEWLAVIPIKQLLKIMGKKPK